MSITTYGQFQEQASSEKCSLVMIEASKRLVGWTLHAGDVYKIPFTFPAIESVEDGGVGLDPETSTTMAAGTYYYDRNAGFLYVHTADSVNPSTKFLGVTFKLYFSNVAVAAPHDMADGYEVPWLPYFVPGAGFRSELDNQNLLGFALEGSGNLIFVNDQSFWQPLFDKVYFENQLVTVWSWHRDLPITEAKKIFRGFIQGKNYDPKKVTFSCKDQLNELRAPVPLVNLEEFGGAVIPPSMLTAKQRLLYGYVKGLVPANISQQLELTGYRISGTATLTTGSKTVTGSFTNFLYRLTPGDEILFGSDTIWYTVEDVASDTSATLTEAYSGVSTSSVTIRIKGSHPKRFMNRVHLIAGHSLREPATEVSAFHSLTSVSVDDPSDFEPGEKVLIGGELMTVRIVSGDRITFTTEMAVAPSVGDPVVMLSMRNVYLNERLLNYDRDYTYDAATATFMLDALAEFNVAQVRAITGSLAFSSASRTVTGTSTSFKAEVKPGDWIRRQGQSVWVEVLKVVSDTEITVRSAPGYTSTGVGDLKKPEVYSEGDTYLSMDVLGATENGLQTGPFIKTAAQMVKNILTRLGLADQLNADSFDLAAEESLHKIGFAIPETNSETKAKSSREIINLINLSVFGSLYQNEDYELEYSILSPKRPTDIVRFAESDVINMAVTSDASKIVKTARVRYLKKEHDPASGEPSFMEAVKVSNAAQYLAKTDKEYLVETVLVDDTQAQNMANRWSFLMELASSVVRFKTSLKASRLSVNDKLDISHEKLYERIGVFSKRKVAGIQAIEKEVGAVTVEASDLSNAFSRCATIAPNGTHDYIDADDEERLYNGFITDNFGLQLDDPETFGCNVIW